MLEKTSISNNPCKTIWHMYCDQPFHKLVGQRRRGVVVFLTLKLLQTTRCWKIVNRSARFNEPHGMFLWQPFEYLLSYTTSESDQRWRASAARLNSDELMQIWMLMLKPRQRIVNCCCCHTGCLRQDTRARDVSCAWQTASATTAAINDATFILILGMVK